MKKTFITILALAGMASATDLQELFYTTDYTEQIDLSTAGLGNENSLTFVLTLDPEKLGDLPTNPYKHNIFQVETGVAGGMGILYWSDVPQFGITQGTSTFSGATEALPKSFSWEDVGGVALTLTTQENIYTDYIQLHAYIVDTNGEELLSISYNEMQFASKNNPTVFGMVNMTELVQSATGYKGTATPDEALALAKQAVVGSNIPEPTTATLSLLALAGLAARRRRR